LIEPNAGDPPLSGFYERERQEETLHLIRQGRIVNLRPQIWEPKFVVDAITPAARFQGMFGRRREFREYGPFDSNAVVTAG
jgi:hypothetical protein